MCGARTGGRRERRGTVGETRARVFLFFSSFAFAFFLPRERERGTRREGKMTTRVALSRLFFSRSLSLFLLSLFHPPSQRALSLSLNFRALFVRGSLFS